MDTKTKTLTCDKGLWPDDGEADALPGTPTWCFGIRCSSGLYGA